MIREATADDAQAIAALDAVLFEEDAWSLGQVVDELTGPGRRGWVVVEDGTVAGYLLTMTLGEVSDLQRVGIAPASRRRGLAARLLDVALAASRADGADRMLLEVAAPNVGALAFYQACGFAQIDRRPRYYLDGSDALVLALTWREITVPGR